ncbi:MAG: hypothetical protein E2O84_00035, partial [Bacteroidetes bacterium]
MTIVRFTKSHYSGFGLIIVGSFLLVLLLIPGDTDRYVATNESAEKDLRETGADQFALYHQLIRTKDGDSAPTYGLNYQIVELKKARFAAKTSFRQIPWQEHGPSNVGGRTRAIVVDSDDPSGETWIAASVSGGIWRTTDAGSSWIHVTPELPNLAF